MRSKRDTKPYKVYRQRRKHSDGSIPFGDTAQSSKKMRVGRKRVFRWIRRTILLAIAVALVWGGIAFLSFKMAVNEQNELIGSNVHNALSPSGGPAFTTAQNILIVGADSSAHRKKNAGDYGLSDTLILLRMDIPSRTWNMLSIPRDLWVDIPGNEDKARINSAYSQGGLALSIRTVRRLTGVEINHVVQVDFDGFKEIVDALGGVEIDAPKAIRSIPTEDGKFDGKHWFFPKGKQNLDGKHALAYARMRKTTDPKETDVTRGLRQQAIIDAITSKMVSIDSLIKPHKVPKAVVKPLVTDIGSFDIMALGFGKFWASSDNTLRCRLGGTSENIGGAAVIIPGEGNRQTILSWLGKRSPTPPNIEVNQYDPGCVRT